MKSQPIRNVSVSFFYLFVLTSLSGCIELAIHPMAREWKKQQEEQMRRIAEEQKQLQLKQQQYAQQQSPPEQKTVMVPQIAPLPTSEEVLANKAEEQRKAESIAQMRELLEQKIFGEADEPNNPRIQRLSPAEKAGLNWAVAQEYWKWHKSTATYEEAASLAKVNGTTAETVLRNNYVKWRDETINKHLTDKGLIDAVDDLKHEQKHQQISPGLGRRGCEWMRGIYYIDRNPSSLCTPVIGACVEGNCNNGYGTYVSFDGSKYAGEFIMGYPFIRPYISGTCLQGNCTNGHGTYAFSDGSKYVGDFKYAKPHGQGTKTWAIGLSYTGEFKHGMPGKGEYTRAASHNLSQAACLEGDCENGRGVLMYQNDTKYVGYFKNKQPHGKGIYYWKTGDAFEGNFDHGSLEKGGNIISSDGSVVVADRNRGWIKTYDEETAVAKRKAEVEEVKTMANTLLEVLKFEAEVERETRGQRCEGRSHKYGTPEYSYCGH